MKVTLERELKLDVDPAFALPEIVGEPLESRIFTSTYHDTPTLSLARAGITLRRRLENGRSLWQLKLPRGDDARAELEALGGPVGPPAELARLLVTHRRHGPFAPVATLRTRRRGVDVREGERSLAEVTVDSVDVLDTKTAFVEVEIELTGGDERDLKRLGKSLRAAGARRSDGLPKVFRVLDVHGVPEPGDDAGLVDQLRYVLALQRRELEARDPGVRLGDDPEDVHQFRVATRRARALIRATRSPLGDTLAPLGVELKWLADLVGPVRDLDVLLDHLAGEVETLGDDGPAGAELLAALGAARDRARVKLLKALDSNRYRTLLDRFDAALGTLPAPGDREDAHGIARRQLGHLRKAVAALPAEPADEELHALRIRVKRARYAAEFAALDGRRTMAKYVEALKRVQDVIGAHQDSVVVEQRLRRLARARTAVAAGRLIERERDRRTAMRDAYPAAVADALERGGKAFGST